MTPASPSPSPSPAAAPSPAAPSLPDASAVVVPQHPIVLVHGLLGFVRRSLTRLLSFSYFQGVEEALRETGIRVHAVPLPASAGVVARAEALAAAVDALPYDRVNLVGHSMGGLDARWYVGRLGGHKKVASLVTISTPHRGTTVADWGCQRIGRALAAWRLFDAIGVDRQAFDDLQRDVCEERNAALLGAPEVPTFSYGAARPWWAIAAPLQVSYRMLQRAEGPNDGLVSIHSARWGESWGTLEADHLAETGWHWTPPGMTRFDHRALYLDIARRLAARGY